MNSTTKKTSYGLILLVVSLARAYHMWNAPKPVHPMVQMINDSNRQWRQMHPEGHVSPSELNKIADDMFQSVGQTSSIGQPTSPTSHPSMAITVRPRAAKMATTVPELSD